MLILDVETFRLMVVCNPLTQSKCLNARSFALFLFQSIDSTLNLLTRLKVSARCQHRPNQQLRFEHIF
jgi:hypothetical protein